MLRDKKICKDLLSQSLHNYDGYEIRLCVNKLP